VPLAGKPMAQWSIDAFGACESVRSIVVAAPPGHVHEFAGGDLEVVPGGATRAQSVANALAVVGTGLVAIHDAARPLVTPELLEALVADLDAAPEAAGAIAAAPVTDTIKRAAEGSRTAFSIPEMKNAVLVVESTEDRSRLWAAQTPQVFRLEALREALAAASSPAEATDEAVLVEAAGGTVLIHPCESPNLKVTTPLDLRVAEMLLAER
jgi:2-C-methyl-D-erythritol 4-phosphate cytidylyltransferase